MRAAPPQLLFILGVDGAGKNHVANVVVQREQERGATVTKRSGYLTARDRDVVTSEAKGRGRLLEERLFLAGFPVLRWFVPTVVDALIRLDLRRWRRLPGPDGAPLTVVISYTPLRVLAFTLGHRPAGAPWRVPPRLDRTLRRLGDIGLRAVVLDVSPEVRNERVRERAGRGRIDAFDRYMTAPGSLARSERIEATLVELACTYLGARHIVNDDLSDDDIIDQVAAAWAHCDATR